MVLTIHVDRERAGACARVNVTIPWDKPMGFRDEANSRQFVSWPTSHRLYADGR